VRNFREWEIWQKAIQFAKMAYELTEKFPSTEKYGLCSQMQRAAVSIASNISEGASRNSEIDFAHFLEISLGSAFELETQLTIAKELTYINAEELEKTIAELGSLQKQINHFITIIRKNH
jgi:four helix bundle protein